MACNCGACVKPAQPTDPLYTWWAFDSGKENQKAKVESTPVITKSFESRVIALAETLFDNKRNLIGYEWGDAIIDAIRILTVEESYL